MYNRAATEAMLRGLGFRKAPGEENCAATYRVTARSTRQQIQFIVTVTDNLCIYTAPGQRGRVYKDTANRIRVWIVMSLRNHGVKIVN